MERSEWVSAAGEERAAPEIYLSQSPEAVIFQFKSHSGSSKGSALLPSGIGCYRILKIR